MSAVTSLGHWLEQEAISTLVCSSADVNFLQRQHLTSALLRGRGVKGHDCQVSSVRTNMHSKNSTVILQWQRCRTVWPQGGQLPG